MTPSACLLLLALAGQGTIPAPAPDATAQAYLAYLQGLIADDRNDLNGAAAAFRNAIDLVPSAAAPHAALAQIYARQGQIDPAAREATAALGIDADNRDAHRVLGFVRAAQADQDPARAATFLAEAIGHFEKVLATGVTDLGAQLTLAQLYVQHGDFTKAIPVLESFLEDRPGYPQAVLLLSDAYRRSGQPAKADAMLRSASGAAGGTSAPAADTLQAKVDRAEAFEDTDNWAAAAAAWRDITSTPAGEEYRARYATALVNSGDVAAGRAVLLAVTNKNPNDVSAWFLLAQVEERRGELAAAEAAARKILAIAPDDSRGPVALAEVQAARGDQRGVIATLAPRVTAAKREDILAGTYARMARDLATAYFESGDSTKGFAVLDEAHAKAPDNEDLLYLAASAYERENQLDKAEQALRDVLALNPANAEALNYLGYLLADHTQKLDEAVTLITKALAIDKDNPSYLDSLGWAYYKQQRYDQATAPLERAAAELPRTSVIQEHLGDLYLQLKRYRDALQAFERALSGDRQGVDMVAVTRKRDRARELAGGF